MQFGTIVYKNPYRNAKSVQKVSNSSSPLLSPLTLVYIVYAIIIGIPFANMVIVILGDIILKVDNIDVKNIQDISRYIENEKQIEDTMVVNVLRNGIMQTINVKLDANPAFLPQLK